jgi:hypothetical protein
MTTKTPANLNFRDSLRFPKENTGIIKLQPGHDNFLPHAFHFIPIIARIHPVSFETVFSEESVSTVT